jgi:hypothetical protein
MSPDGLSHPSVSAELDGVAGDFVIDTGASGQTFVSENFQREHHPFAESGRTLQFMSAGGIGGRTNIQIGFGKRRRIGPFTLSPPLVAGSMDAKLGSSAGLIGTTILAQFVVTIDNQSARAYFEPVAGRTLTTVLHGTGMILDKPDHETFEVLDVLKGTARRAASRRSRRRDRRPPGARARHRGFPGVQFHAGAQLRDNSHLRPAPPGAGHRSAIAVTARWLRAKRSRRSIAIAARKPGYRSAYSGYRSLGSSHAS